MKLPREPSRIFALVNVLVWMIRSSLDYWLRLVREAQDGNANGHREALPDYLDSHHQRLWRLLDQAAAFPDTQATGAELALLLDPVMQAKGHQVGWLPVVRHLAVNLDNGAVDDPLTVALLWRCASRCYRETGDFTRAKLALEFARRLTEHGGQGEPGLDLDMELRQELGAAKALQAHFEDAEQIALDMLDDACRLGDIYTEAHGRALLAFAYLESYRPTPAFEQAQQAYLLWRRLDNEKGQARALHYMGEACRLKSRFNRARFYLESARVWLDKLQEQPLAAHLEHALGALALEEQRFQEALERIRRAKTIFEEIGDVHNTINSTQALGMALTKVGEYSQAENALKQALTGWDRLGVHLEAANVHFSLGDLYRQNGQIAEARRAFQEALQTARKLSPGEHRDWLIRELGAELGTL